MEYSVRLKIHEASHFLNFSLRKRLPRLEFLGLTEASLMELLDPFFIREGLEMLPVGLGDVVGQKPEVPVGSHDPAAEKHRGRHPMLFQSGSQQIVGFVAVVDSHDQGLGRKILQASGQVAPDKITQANKVIAPLQELKMSIGRLGAWRVVGNDSYLPLLDQFARPEWNGRKPQQ